MSVSRTIIISCAGMGNRLGVGTTKALVEVEGKPLIIRQLEQLKDETDIRIVVGFQADKVIEVVKKYRDDVLFVFNHEYRTTGTGASVSYAMRYANEYILSLDGDLLIHPSDMQKILTGSEEFIGGTQVCSDDPWFLQTYEQDNKKYVKAFSHENGEYEWTGVVQIKTERLVPSKGHVYPMIEVCLPLRLNEIRTKEIDTINDYENAVKWVKNNYEM